MATGPLVNAAVDSGDFTRLLIEDANVEIRKIHPKVVYEVVFLCIFI